MPILYLDVLLFLNLFIDFLLLSATARLLHIPHRRPRLLGGAAVGAVSSLLILLPTLPTLVTIGGDLLFAALMVRVAFRFCGYKAYFTQVGVLFLLSAVFGGITYGIRLFAAPTGLTVHNGVLYYDVPSLWLVGTTLLSYAAIWGYDRIASRRLPSEQEYRVTVTHRGVSVTLKTLYDTGNHLTEQFSGAPVIVAQADAVTALSLPDWETMPTDDVAQAARHRLRLLPFSSLGGEGLLPAFCPDRVIVRSSLGETRTVDGAYLALTHALGRGNYQALCGRDIAALFQKGENAR